MFCRQEFSSFKVWGVSCFLKPHFVGWPTDFVLSVVISVRKTSFPFSCRAVTGMLFSYRWNYRSVVGTFPVSIQAVLEEKPNSLLIADWCCCLCFCSFNFHTVICLLQTFPVILYHTHECFLLYLAFFFFSFHFGFHSLHLSPATLPFLWLLFHFFIILPLVGYSWPW